MRSDTSFGSQPGLASATSANGTKRNGASLLTTNIAVGTLAVDVSTTIVTGSVVNTITFEVSHDDATWLPLRGLENTAPTTITTTAERSIVVPSAVFAYKHVRVCCTLSGAATAAGDLTAATYRFVRDGHV
jgi:hypothetical protein